jgi:hypothetical protein
MEKSNISMLERLINKKYFHRIWVVQELLLARDVLLVYGPHEFSLSLLRELVQQGGLSSRLPCTLGMLAPCTGPESLLDLLAASRSTGASDPRDKVFALLGIVLQLSGRPAPMKPDYRLSQTQVFMDAARIVVSHRGTEIFEHTENRFGNVCCSFCQLKGHPRCLVCVWSNYKCCE